MNLKRVPTTDCLDTLRITLENGFAERMGEGLFILFQESDGRTQSLVLSGIDLVALLAAT